MRVFLTGLLLVSGLQVSGLRAQEGGPSVGARAPVVQVPDLNGKPVDLGQYLGRRPVFLEWWATWCEQCEALLPRVRAARAQVGDRVAFFGINVAVNQSPERVRRFLEKTEVPYQTLYDEEGVSTRAYAAPATSYVVIVDRTGRIAYTGTGGDQDFLPALQRVAAP
jgi:peroxiredoxin